MTDEDFFLHGAAYPSPTKVREKCCGTCAFKVKGATVRPAAVTVDQLQAWSLDYDDFVCHEPTPAGDYPRCAAWQALTGKELEAT